ncbi:Hint domain-containing protein [Streptomyces mangrovisoli]|uniref:Hint domain-containing protein n=1 Tax=Streptomyces mangrovisoli TaxID=1428628 RepID=UPI001160577D|nr:Hint domain-containing protein [Streptomyces mangrovisoli]
MVFSGCEAVVTAGSGGALSVPGAIGCGALAGAAAGLVDQGSKCMGGQQGVCSVSAFATSTVLGAVGGAVGGGIGRALGGKLAASALGKALPKLVTNVLGGAAIGGISGGATGAADYGLTCSETHAGCSWSGAAAASAEGAESGVEGGAIGGVIATAGGAMLARGCGTTHSFTGSTKVVMADGSTRPIEDIKAGDRIKDAVPGGKATETHTVTRVIVTRTDHDFVDVTVTSTSSKRGASAEPGATERETAAGATERAAKASPGLAKRLQTETGTATVTAVRLYHAHTTTYDLTIGDLHTYYVLAGTTPILVHNTDALKCDLRAYTDLARLAPGKNEGAASVLLTPSGNAYFDISTRRAGEALRSLPLSLRRVIEQTGHHGGCAEIGCIAQAMEAGDLVRGSSSLAMLRKPFDHIRYRDLLPACPQCQAVMSRLRITDLFQG